MGYRIMLFNNWRKNLDIIKKLKSRECCLWYNCIKYIFTIKTFDRLLDFNNFLGIFSLAQYFQFNPGLNIFFLMFNTITICVHECWFQETYLLNEICFFDGNLYLIHHSLDTCHAFNYLRLKVYVNNYSFKFSLSPSDDYETWDRKIHRHCRLIKMYHLWDGTTCLKPVTVGLELHSESFFPTIYHFRTRYANGTK